MFRSLLLLVMALTAAGVTSPPVAARAWKDAASELVGVQAKLVQLRNELKANQVALANKGLSQESQASLNERAKQISSEINVLLDQEKKLSKR